MAQIFDQARSTDADRASVRTTARTGAADRYLSALLAPRAVRDDLIALAAFSADIEKIPRQVSDPQLGEIRIQWWRDVLDATSLEHRSGHPVADSLRQTVARHHLPLDKFNDYLDAQAHALYADPPADEVLLGLALDFQQGFLFETAAQILGAQDVSPYSAILHNAAQAYGLAHIGLTLPYALARGRSPLPTTILNGEDPASARLAIDRLTQHARAHLQQVRSAYRAAPAAIRTALLPVALVEPYLRALTRPTHNAIRDIADIAPLTRTWRLAKTHFSGRL